MKNSIKEIKCAVIIGEYINGNYKVSIYSDGTKIRENNLEFLIPSKPEAIDMKITDCCDIGCPYCHENSLPNGLHGDILNAKFIDTLLPYTEVAIGGGNPLSHPGLVEFLHVLKDKSVIANITINQKHFLEKHE
ncbi:MAG: radical SAM protein, partial [Bacteroides sp.]